MSKEQEIAEAIQKALSKVFGEDVEVSIKEEPCPSCGEVHSDEEVDHKRLEVIALIDQRIATHKRLIVQFEKLQASLATPMDQRTGFRTLTEVLITREIDALMGQL